MKYNHLHYSLLAASLCSFLPQSGRAEPPAIKIEVSSEANNPFETNDALPAQKESTSSSKNAKSDQRAEQKSVSSSSSSSSQTSSSTTSVNGKTVTTTRTTGPDGKEKITVTTQGRSGKPKVESFTPEEYEQKFGPKKKAPPAEKSAAAPSPAEKSNSQRATE